MRSHFHASKLGMVCIFVLGLALIVYADESLDAAKQERATNLRKAEQEFLNAFDDAIVAAAKVKDTESIKALIEQKEAFQEQKQGPTLKIIEAAFEKYIVTRQSLNAKMQTEYQKAISDSAAKLLLPKSAAIDKEARELAEREQQEIKKIMTRTTELLSIKKTKTRDQLEEFQALYQEQIDLIAQTNDEKMAKQIRAELPDKLNKYLKNRNWSFHCEIKEIKDINPNIGGPDQYSISIAPPEELKGWQSSWKFMGTLSVRLKKSEADKVKPGQIFVISGYPRFSRGTGNSFMHVQLRDNDYFHRLEFPEFKFNIRKPLTDEADEESKK